MILTEVACCVPLLACHCDIVPIRIFAEYLPYSQGHPQELDGSLWSVSLAQKPNSLAAHLGQVWHKPEEEVLKG